MAEKKKNGPKGYADGIPVYCAHDAIVPIGDLKPNPKNPNRHPYEQIARLGAVIRGNGWRNPITVSNRSGFIVKGHGRLLAALHEDLAEVPVDFQNYDSEAAEIADLMADNKIAELSEADEKQLAALFEEIGAEDLPIERTGYSVEEYTDIAAALSAAMNAELEADPDDAPEAAQEVVSRPGDIWILGDHHVMCGDCTDAATVQLLTGGVLADLVFTDPPYNVDYTNGKEDERKILNDDFATDDEAAARLWLPAFRNMRAAAKESCAFYCCMPQGSTHMVMMMMMMMKAGWQIKHEIIWRKQSIVLNRADYNYQHEPIAYGWNVRHKFYGRGKYHTTSVWEYDRPTKSKEHPTMKPIALITEAIENSSNIGDVVLDLFGGSGSTLIACELARRICYMMELAPEYVDVIVRRYVKVTGKTDIRCIREGKELGAAALSKILTPTE